MFKKTLLKVVLGFAMVCFGTVAFATYPERPVTLVIPLSAGGSHDQNARVIADMMPLFLGQSMEVKLSPGDAGRLGTSEVANADPDGYTLLFTQNYIDMLQQHVVDDLPYAPLDDFVPVARVNFAPISIVVRADSPYDSFAELMEAGRARPGSLTVGHSGNWGATFVPAVQIMQATQSKFELVAFQGGGPTLRAVLSGDVDVTLAFPSAIEKLKNNGEIKVLATAGESRLYLDVPSFAEVGLTGDVGFMHRVVLAPANTPSDIVATLGEAFDAMVNDLTYVSLMAEIGENVDHLDGPTYQRLRVDQNQAYKALVTSIGP